MPTPIKPEDLRVGNLVQSKYGKTIVVESIVSNYGINVQAGDGNCMYCDYKESEIFGIPLTEEWLLKLGFNSLWDIVFYNDDGDSFYLAELNHIQYVHQFQNFYFAWYGKEAEFTTP